MGYPITCKPVVSNCDDLCALFMSFRYWQCLESSLWSEARSAVLSYQFDSRSDPVIKKRGFTGVRSLSMHGLDCCFNNKYVYLIKHLQINLLHN